uniref:Transmembrane protein n=1 Tax=Cacopsylla melanoneura TaxID=428564 RepID=A0A8D8TA44_9HEMI
MQTTSLVQSAKNVFIPNETRSNENFTQCITFITFTSHLIFFSLLTRVLNYPFTRQVSSGSGFSFGAPFLIIFISACLLFLGINPSIPPALQPYIPSHQTQFSVSVPIIFISGLFVLTSVSL